MTTHRITLLIPPALILCAAFRPVLVQREEPVHASATPAAALDEPDSVERAPSGAAGLWKLRSEHLIWGMPKQTDNRHNIKYTGETMARPGISVLVREGFVIGHYDFYKVPAWVAVHWTREYHDRMDDDNSFGRHFSMDAELPKYAQAGTSYDYSTSRMERGHMARHEDNEAWGEDNSTRGCRMSNVVPQHRDMNGEAWLDLEELSQDAVVNRALGIDELWVISGPIFEDSDNDGHDDAKSFVGNNVAVPHATYKIIGWFDAQKEFHARGYVVRQESRVRHNPKHYLKKIDDIEKATGLDFFPELPVNRAAEIEGVDHDDIWEENTEDHSGDNGTVRIVSVLPNPVGPEREGEAVTLRNSGTTDVSLAGWKLKDRRNTSWDLSGVIQAGDEITIKRNGQFMALNNSGDDVKLINARGQQVDMMTYGRAAEGAVISR